MGTSVGTKLFADGGYKLSAGTRAAFGGCELLLLLLRGPNVARKKWVGWEGGVDFKKRDDTTHEV